VSDNRIVLATPGAIGVIVAGSGNTVAGNRLEGGGTFGILVTPVPPLKAANNDVAGNDLTQLKPARGEIVLTKGANQNKVSGRGGSVTDAGEGNVTEGVQRVTAAAN
jgi:hypothetical protein